jgi:RNA recognition motif-containing protein
MANIFCSNVSFKKSEADLKDLFSDFGVVDRCKIVLDKDTGKSRGFAFVEMADGDGSRAIKALNGFEFGGRELVVKIATPKQ